METEKSRVEGSSPKTWSTGTLTYTTMGLVGLFSWLLWGDFAWAMKDRTMYPTVSLMVKTFDITNLQYSLLIIAFPNFTNIFLCPIISYISDRHRGRWGRRIPFLMFATPFVVVGAIGIGFAPMLGSRLYAALDGSISLNLACILCFTVFWVLLDFGTTLSGALSGALINDVVPRSVIGRFMGLFRGISLLAGMLYNYWIIGHVEGNYCLVFTCIGLLYGFGLMCLCLKVKEGSYPPPPPIPPSSGSHVKRIFRPLMTYFRQTFTHPYYIWLSVALSVSGLAAAPFNMFAVLYAKSDAINIPMETYGKICCVTFGISFVLSYVLGFLSDRFHPLRTSIVSLLIYLTAMILGWFIVKDATTYGIALFVHNVLSGCYFTLSASLAQRLFPQALFAQFSSACGIIGATMTVLFSSLLGLFLEAVGGDYRYLFVFGAGTTLLAAGCLLRVLFLYNRYGGDAAYQPPAIKE